MQTAQNQKSLRYIPCDRDAVENFTSKGLMVSLAHLPAVRRDTRMSPPILRAMPMRNLKVHWRQMEKDLRGISARTQMNDEAIHRDVGRSYNATTVAGGASAVTLVMAGAAYDNVLHDMGMSKSGQNAAIGMGVGVAVVAAGIAKYFNYRVNQTVQKNEREDDLRFIIGKNQKLIEHHIDAKTSSRRGFANRSVENNF